MKLPNLPDIPIKSKFIPFKGGINESDSFTSMYAGELIGCENYEGVAGAYPGYRSIAGYEVFDGQPSPSSVDIIDFQDTGNDIYTKLLLSPSFGFEDQSRLQQTISNVGVTIVDTPMTFNSSSYSFTGDTLTSSSSPNVDGDFCLEFSLQYTGNTGVSIIAQKTGVFQLILDDKTIKANLSTNGTIYDVQLIGVELSVYNPHHIALVKYGEEVTLFVRGSLVDTDTLPDNLHNNTNMLIIGSLEFTGLLSEIRLSEGSPRYFLSYTVPEFTFTSSAYYNEIIDDTDRELARLGIEEVPGDGPISGGFIFDNDIYSIRDDLAAGYAKVYKATATGWELIAQPEGNELTVGGTLTTFTNRFQGFSSNTPVIILTDGVSIPRVFDGTTFTIIDHANLPVSILPTLAGVYDNRLFLAYGPSVFFSAVGDPLDFGGLGNAGELLLGDSITNIVYGPGNSLIITTNTFINILKYLDYTDESWIFQNDTFSRTTGSYAKSGQSFLGDTYMASTEGIVALTALDAYGGFAANTLSKRANNTYQRLKDTIVGSLVDTANSQYKLFFSNGVSITITFDIEKKVKDITLLNYRINIKSLFTDGNRVFFTTTDNSFIYELGVGTSFNTEPITSFLRTAYHSYGSSTSWKRFRKMSIDMEAGIGTTFKTRHAFTYGDSSIKHSLVEDNINTVSSDARWGHGKWGQFRWGSAAIRTMPLYDLGQGTCLSTAIQSSSKYRDTHTIQSLTIDYSVGKRRI